VRKTILIFYLIFFVSAILPYGFVNTPVKNIDLVIHFSYFFFLSLLIFPLINIYFSVLVLILFSLITEFLQIPLPLRDFSQFDLFADIAGIILAFLTYRFILKKEKNVFLILSSIFGIGFIKGGGTIASLLAIILFYLLNPSVITVLILVIITLFLTIHFKKYLRIEKDPSFFVLDEFSGMLIILPFVPFNHFLISLCFVLYRAFDIIKPFGIKKLEKIKILGVLLDDWAGAILTALIIVLIKFLYHQA